MGITDNSSFSPSILFPQAGVHLLNRLPKFFKDAPMRKAFKTRLKYFYLLKSIDISKIHTIKVIKNEVAPARPRQAVDKPTKMLVLL